MMGIVSDPGSVKFFSLYIFWSRQHLAIPTHPPCHQTSSFGHPNHPPLWWSLTWKWFFKHIVSVICFFKRDGIPTHRTFLIISNWEASCHENFASKRFQRKSFFWKRVGKYYTANPFPVLITGISLCSNSTL